jgi:GTP-binding protein HflX
MHAKERIRLARMQEQPGFMGLGAYEVNVYHMAVKRQINFIKNKLRKIRRKRKLHRERRDELDFLSISLAGYTNAGKSSLFKALTKQEVPIDEGLFTTLSTKTRLLELSKKKVLLTDTVGFIDRLPLTLIEAFHSTLEETIYSDLILLVVDLSEEEEKIQKKILVCQDTLKKIGADRVPKILVLNKIDLLTNSQITSKVKKLRKIMTKLIPISALRNINLDLLKEETLKKLKNSIQAYLKIPLSDKAFSLISTLYKETNIQKIEYKDKNAQIFLEITPLFAQKIRKQIREIDGVFKLVYKKGDEKIAKNRGIEMGA